MMTKVISLKQSTKSPDEIYIGRAGKGREGYFGNPIVKGNVCIVCNEIHEAAGETLLCYTTWLKNKIATDEEYADMVEGLRGKTLVCFCRPKEGFQGKLMCHGQVLAGLLDGVDPECVE